MSGFKTIVLVRSKVHHDCELLPAHRVLDVTAASVKHIPGTKGFNDNVHYVNK